MSKLVKLVDGIWTFLGNKHCGEPIEKVARSDPSYLCWAWREASGFEDPEVFHLLDDVARKHGIDTDRAAKRENRSFRNHQITHDRGRKRRG
jgi:hypothetical protein